MAAPSSSPFGAAPLVLAVALFAGAVLAAALKFGVPLVVLGLGALALFFLAFIVTVLNPVIRHLFLFGGGVLAGAAAATAAWLH